MRELIWELQSQIKDGAKSISDMIYNTLLTASGLGVDPEEAWSAVLAGVVAAYGPGPQPDPLAPGQRVQPQVAGDHRHVEVVSPLRLDVHVATENLEENGLKIALK